MLMTMDDDTDERRTKGTVESNKTQLYYSTGSGRYHIVNLKFLSFMTGNLAMLLASQEPRPACGALQALVCLVQDLPSTGGHDYPANS